jgi:hypothetical protein
LARDLHRDPAQQEADNTQAAGGGPKPIGQPAYAEVALKLLDNGYEPLPLYVRKKRPIPEGWTELVIDEAQVRRWIDELPDSGVGIRTGHAVGIDIDVLDPEIAHEMGRIVEERSGASLMRVGIWPKRLYLVRTEHPFAKKSIRKLEILGLGQQFVTFGIHPDTRKPYYWTDETPLDVPLVDLPLVDEATCTDLLNELAALLPPIGDKQRKSTPGRSTGDYSGPTRNEAGFVIDGRDGWLSTIAYHAVHDAIDAGQNLELDSLADRVWERFASSTDLSRGKKDRRSVYDHQDALQKVRDKLALHVSGRLPPRAPPEARPVEVSPGIPADEARVRLTKEIAAFCQLAEDWSVSGREGRGPRIGIRASVGLGKSAISRAQLLALQARLKHAGLPHRILVFVQSLALADEAKVGWKADGIKVAVHRGYEAMMPGLGTPMCRDLDMVRMAVKSGLSVFPNACLRRGGASCHNFDACAKQANLREVDEADIIVAAYDSLFTGLSTCGDKFGLMVIDEGCWERAVRQTHIGLAEITAIEATYEPRMADPGEEERAWTELSRLRARAVAALVANGPGPLCRQHLMDAGLSVQDCAAAAALEVQLRVDPGLRPGLPQAARRRATDLSRDADRSVRREALFRAKAALLHGSEDRDGRIRILEPNHASGTIAVEVRDLLQIDEDFAHLPVLHLDAMLRPELANTVLPGLEVIEISAEMPHMRLTSVQGGFGKSSLVEDPKAAPNENRRRRNRLQECVDHVRWEAARVAPGRTLVVTYQAIEAAFAGIPGVETGHFKAIAGLDVYKDVALLIVIGRPLPGSDALAKLTSAHLGGVPMGDYNKVRRGLLMRDGSRRTVSAIEHEDPLAELMRAAVCDDEVIQAIGRGRGVNRTAANPLEVQVLADVALPMVHDRVVPWDSVVPDVLQHMLLAGIAVDSPAVAAALHPQLLPNVEQAKKAFQRGAFRGHFPIGNTYRDLSLKSARFLRGGRGHSWQRAWWIGDAEPDARRRLETAIGKLAAWTPL